VSILDFADQNARFAFDLCTVRKDGKERRNRASGKKVGHRHWLLAGHRASAKRQVSVPDFHILQLRTGAASWRQANRGYWLQEFLAAILIRVSNPNNEEKIALVTHSMRLSLC